MERQDIIPMPTWYDMETAIDESMDYMYMVRTSFTSALGTDRTTALVYAQPHEIIPLITAYYGIKDMRNIKSQSKSVPDVKGDIWPSILRVTMTANCGCPLELDTIRNGGSQKRRVKIVAVSLTHSQWGFDVMQKCNNQLLCSRWGYNQLIEYYND